ncbi:MAG: hypothetical protein KKG84_06320 [Candidatus Omnitrophica bacterium]|nr:hypothetical protein [Candidatus Omnitrophota bacterium]
MLRFLFRITCYAVCLLGVTVLSSGCAQLRDKFVRKPKEEVSAKRFYAVKEYDVRPSLELYTKRYVFWKTWHKELLDVLPKENSKKITVAVEQELSNLMDMRNMLTEDRAVLLQKDVDELAEIEQEIKSGGVTRGNRVQIRRKLEEIGRRVKRDFTYKKMGGKIRNDFPDK